jgi:hypothetical protein
MPGSNPAGTLSFAVAMKLAIVNASKAASGRPWPSSSQVRSTVGFDRFLTGDSLSFRS